jgi:hypothetical protein
MKLDKIFISHKSPEDNYFAAWLASKLKHLGFEVWLELDELKSGDAFWPAIEDAIRQQSIKFLVIISQAYLESVKNPRSGIFKELSCADRIDIKNFKTPIRIENIDRDTYPVQLMGLGDIDFYNNWQEGLNKLLESLQKEGIHGDSTKAENPMNFWLDAFNIKHIENNEAEWLYTNWFPVELPQKIYVHRVVAKEKLSLVDIPFPFLEYSDRHISFFPASDYPPGIECLSSKSLVIEDIIKEQAIPIDEALVFNQPRKKVVELLNKVFRDFLLQLKLKRYEQANGEVFYFPNNGSHGKRISLKSVGKTNVSVTGKTKGNFWSYGISHYASLYPFPYFKINSHIIFETADLVVLPQEEQHTLRRAFGFDWYNRDWLDTMIGMMLKISRLNGEHKIVIPISRTENLVVNAIPYSVSTDFGYYEPEKMDQEDA